MFLIVSQPWKNLLTMKQTGFLRPKQFNKWFKIKSESYRESVGALYVILTPN